MESISVDFAIIEKADNVVTIPSNFGWCDIGNWKTIYDISKKDINLNVIDGNCILFNTKGCLIKGERKKAKSKRQKAKGKEQRAKGKDRLIATIGVKDLLIIDEGNVLLICAKEDAQDVKKIVEMIEEKGWKEYL